MKNDSNIPIHTLQSVLANWARRVKIKQSAINSHRFGQKSPLTKGEKAVGLWGCGSGLVQRRYDNSSAVSEQPQSPNVRRSRKRIRRRYRVPSPQRGRGAGGEGAAYPGAQRLAKRLAAVLLLFSSSESDYAAGKLSRFEKSEPHMGTVARIVVYAPNFDAAAAATRAAFQRIRELDGILSDYQAESELNRLSHQSGGPPVKVGPDLFRVLSTAQNLAVRSDGAFDVTVGPLIRLWRRARRQRALPEADRLAAALDVTGFRWLSLNTKQQTAQLAKTGMLLDVGGIAKGFAADEALQTLTRAGIEQALVALGGDISVSSPPPGRKGWSIEIASLNLAGAPKPPPLLLHNAAVSTSGDAEQFVEIGSIRYSHIVDPRTGKALTGRRSVTVVAAHGIDSDALATAVSVMDPAEGLKLIDATRAASALIVVQTSSGIQTWKSKRWKK